MQRGEKCLNKIITVFTPIYNREILIKKLYKSLISQTNKEFVWLIVDDGSTDGSRQVIESFCKEKIIDIKYIYQNNMGKYIAHNTGVKNCMTDLFVCVDSDDILLPEAVEKTLEKWKVIQNKDKICGIVSPKKIQNMGGLMDCPPEYSSLMDLYNKGILRGETMLVFKTKILKNYLFPEISNEKFMSESVIYEQIDYKYKLAIQNEFLYEAEYQNDGLTRNIDLVHWKNPYSTLLSYEISALYQTSFIKSIKAYGCYLAWKKIHQMKRSNDKVKNPRLLVILGGYFLSFHYYQLFERQKKS